MKINVPKTGDFQKKTPILTLVDNASACSVNKANAVSFDLKADPAEADSSTQKQMFGMLAGGETIRQILRWKSNDGASVAPLSVNFCFGSKFLLRCSIFTVVSRPLVVCEVQITAVDSTWFL